MKTPLHYTPDCTTPFHCRVPLPAAQPFTLVNGRYVNRPAPTLRGVTVAPGHGGMGIVLTVAAGQVMEQPVQIINIRNAENIRPVAYAAAYTAAPHSQAKLVICDHTLSSDAFTTETTTDIYVKEGAHLELVWMQNEHNRSTHRSVIRIWQEAHSQFICNMVTLHGAQIENSLSVKLQGVHARCRANGLFLIDKQQKFQTDIMVSHEVPGCSSYQLFKGIADDEAEGRFHGKVLVAKDAQKTEAYQVNNNLLLTRQAKIITRPQLEIYADDVKCSHGATVGQLDEQALFYLRSRGISMKDARLLQQIGFVQDVLDKISIVSLRERVVDLVTRRLQGEFSRCTDCERHCC